jgi:hypothetical protein
MTNSKKILAGGIVAGALLTSGYIASRDTTPTDRPTTIKGDKDCVDFKTQREAQSFFEANGGPNKDPHNLDRDKDGVVCESLP